MAPYAQARMYQKGHGVGSALASFAGRYALPLGKKLINYGLNEGVGYLTDKLIGKKNTGKQRLKSVALKGLGSVRKTARGGKASKVVGRPQKPRPKIRPRYTTREKRLSRLAGRKLTRRNKNLFD